MNLKNYWIKTLIVVISFFFYNSVNADVKIKAGEQVSNFLHTIKDFASEKDPSMKVKKSDKLLDMVDLEFMSKLQLENNGKQLMIMKKLYSKENFLTNLYNLLIYISKILKKLNLRKIYKVKR